MPAVVCDLHAEVWDLHAEVCAAHAVVRDLYAVRRDSHVVGCDCSAVVRALYVGFRVVHAGVCASYAAVRAVPAGVCASRAAVCACAAALLRIPAIGILQREIFQLLEDRTPADDLGRFGIGGAGDVVFELLDAEFAVAQLGFDDVADGDDADDAVAVHDGQVADAFGHHEAHAVFVG